MRFSRATGGGARPSVKRTRRWLAVLVSVAGLAGVLVSVAQASVAQAVGPCDNGAFCAYKEPNFDTSSTHYEWQAAVANWPTNIDDDEDSVNNNGTISAPVQVYDSINYSDPHYCVRRGIRLNLPSNKDNDGNSHRWNSSSSGCF